MHERAVQVKARMVKAARAKVFMDGEKAMDTNTDLLARLWAKV